MPEGKYFFIRSKLNGLVVDIAGHQCEAGREIVLEEKRDVDNDTQIWYEEQFTGTIRSKLHDFCLTVNDDNILVVDEYQERSPACQEWIVAMDKLQGKSDAKQLLELNTDVADAADVRVRRGELVVGAKQQLWDIEYMRAIYFYIVSELNGKVISVMNAERKPDAKIIVEDRQEGAEHQLWYEGKLGHVRSKMNNFVLETKKDEKGASTRLMPFEPGNTKQLWTQYGTKLVSLVHPKFCLATKHRSLHNGAKVVINYDENLPHQRWTIDEQW